MFMVNVRCDVLLQWITNKHSMYIYYSSRSYTQQNTITLSHVLCMTESLDRYKRLLSVIAVSVLNSVGIMTNVTPKTHIPKRFNMFQKL